MILVASAMIEECKYILDNLKNKEIVLNNPLTYKGILNDKELLVCITKIGKSNASYSLGKLFGLFKIDLVINLGLVGGSKNLFKNKVYVVSRTTYSDFDLSFFNEYAPIYETKSYLLNKLNKYDKVFLYTADKFISKELDVNFDYICDMEGTSLYQVCDIENVDIISIKFISDIIGGSTQKNEYYKSKEKINSSEELYNAFLEVLK